MAKGDAHQPSELETCCHHGWAIELDVHHPSAEGQQRGYATIFYLTMCDERNMGERAFLEENRRDENVGKLNETYC